MKPVVEIRSGLGIDFEGRLLEFSYEDNDKKKDKVKIKLDNSDRELLDWYPPGATATVRWGYPGNMTPWRVVQFRRVTGLEELTFEANSLETVMDRVERAQAFYNVTYSEIATQIASTTYGFAGRFLNVEDTEERHDLVNQLGESDAVFLKRLASEEGFLFYVDDTGFHFHAPKYDAPPIRVLTWRTELQDATPIISEPQLDFDLLRHYKKIKKKKLEPEDKGILEELADAFTDTDAKELGTKATDDNLFHTEFQVDSTGFEGPVKVYDTERALALLGEKAKETEDPVLMSFASHHEQDPNFAKLINPAIVQQMLADSTKLLQGGGDQKAKKKKRALAAVRIKFKIKTEGDPTLRAKEIVRVLGIGKILEGNFYTKQATHMIGDGGYDCNLDIRKHNPEKNPKKGKMENTGAQVNANEETGFGEPVTWIDEKDRVYEMPPGFIGPV